MASSLCGIAHDLGSVVTVIRGSADLARNKAVTTVFSETLVSPRVARTVAREAGGLRVATLNPLESLSAGELRAGADYVSVMRANLRALRTALGCT